MLSSTTMITYTGSRDSERCQLLQSRLSLPQASFEARVCPASAIVIVPNAQLSWQVGSLPLRSQQLAERAADIQRLVIGDDQRSDLISHGYGAGNGSV